MNSFCYYFIIFLHNSCFIVYKNSKLGKAKNEADAKRTLKLISGNTIKVYSGVCIIDLDNDKSILDCEISKIKVKSISSNVIFLLG